MTSGIHYRALDASNDMEVAAIAEIHEQAPMHWIPGYVPKPEQIQRRIKELRRPDGRVCRFSQIAEVPEGSIVGFHWIDLEEADGETFGHVKSLWVHSDYQHRGIATELKKNGELWAKQKGARYLKTTVHANNPKMLAFNLRSGFEQGFIEMTKTIQDGNPPAQVKLKRHNV